MCENFKRFSKKSFVAAALMLVFGLSSLNAQESSAASATGSNTEKNGNVELSIHFDSSVPLLLHQDNIVGFHCYMLADGTKVYGKKLNELLCSVEGNNELVKKASVWNGMAYVGVGLTAACAIVPLFVDNEVVQVSCYAGGVVFLAGALLSSMVRDSYTARAVDRYNIRIMGIPIR